MDKLKWAVGIMISGLEGKLLFASLTARFMGRNLNKQLQLSITLAFQLHPATTTLPCKTDAFRSSIWCIKCAFFPLMNGAYPCLFRASRHFPCTPNQGSNLRARKIVKIRTAACTLLQWCIAITSAM
jgi:hypothetical protein